MTTHEEVAQFQNRLVATWAIMLGLIVVLLFPTVQRWLNDGVSGDPRPITPRGDLAAYEKTTVDLFREVSDSVVYIDTKAAVGNPWTLQRYEKKSGTGSGFVWDNAGHIVTNYHVIERASSAEVVFADQTRYMARLVGVSEAYDLAVLRVDAAASALKPVLIGESHDLKVGQSVFAIGNPFGLDQTLTTGVVSNRSRAIEGPSGRAIENVIQIDAAINPGNSGGPLMDSAGRLIGVNTSIYSTSGSSAGIGFAIPVDSVNRVVPEIIEEGAYTPPRIGIQTDSSINALLLRQRRLQAVVVVAVQEGSPAEAAGLRGLRSENGNLFWGDLILKLGEDRVTNLEELFTALDHYESGDEVLLTILRDGEETPIPILLD